jgi:hypothetical protein
VWLQLGTNVRFQEDGMQTNASGIGAAWLAASLLAGPAFAQESVSPPAHRVHEAHGEGSGRHGSNVASLFLGATAEKAESETFFTVGGEYERRLADRWGFQVAAEYISGFDAWVVAVPLAVRPVGGLWIGTGPGLQTKPGRPGPEGHEGHDEHAEEEDGPFFLWRVKAGYSVHLGDRVSAMPSVSLDLVREHGEWVAAWVVGVSVGLHF